MTDDTTTHDTATHDTATHDTATHDTATGELLRIPGSELADGAPRRFDHGEHRVAVVRIGDEVFAIGDRCSHANYSLSEGEVDRDECTLECWKHGSAFSLRTGEPETLPATQPVPVYPVAIEGSEVVVRLS